MCQDPRKYIFHTFFTNFWQLQLRLNGSASQHSQDTLFFGQFINPKLHYLIFAKIVIMIFTEMSGEIILILVLSNVYFSTPSNLHTAMKNFPYLILCSGQNTSLLIQVTLSTW